MLHPLRWKRPNRSVKPLRKPIISPWVFKIVALMKLSLKHTIEQVGLRNSWKHFSVFYALQETHAFGVYDLSFQNYGINEIRFETYHWTDWAQKQLKMLFQCSMLSSKPKLLKFFSTFRLQFSKLWHWWIKLRLNRNRMGWEKLKTLFQCSMLSSKRKLLEFFSTLRP